MGCCYLNCMVSGVPIDAGDEAVAFWIRPAGVRTDIWYEPWENWKFATFPIHFTMDDYQGSSLFEPISDDIAAQTSWRIFWSQLYSPSNKMDDWFRDIHWGKVGLRDRPIFRNPENIKADPIIPLCYTVVRKDFYDYVISLSPVENPRGVTEEELDETMKSFAKANPNLPEENHRRWRTYQKQRKTSDRSPWLGRHLFEEGVFDAVDHETIYKMIDETRRFANGLGRLARPIIPALSMCPQENWHCNWHVEAIDQFHAKIREVIAGCRRDREEC